MAAKFLLIISILSLFLILLTFANPSADAELAGQNAGVGILNETLEWGFDAQYHLDPETIEQEEGEDEDGLPRRSLYWKWPGRRRYYISYGALSANRVPCPARSGRSYYTHNCFRAHGPVNPYTRSCSAITRCRR
ncbi:ralf-like 34 [Striga asiatica]|uniref:Ralf-like 34 n=1 Tax=Striga asiatica TaxID=4170 RepID=A0A5A7PC15_STRAF|nr:ralf-like 34 [Striga asiatica]